MRDWICGSMSALEKPDGTGRMTVVGGTVWWPGMYGAGMKWVVGGMNADIVRVDTFEKAVKIYRFEVRFCGCSNMRGRHLRAGRGLYLYLGLPSTPNACKG